MVIKKWFILAGGSATRWKGYQGVVNKCYVKVDEETLLERTERLLRANGIEDIEIVLEGYNSKREAFEGVARKAQCAFGILLGDCYYTEAIIKDAVNRDVDSWKHYYNCLPNYWTGCFWEEGYIHLVPNWEWWLIKMGDFNRMCNAGVINFVKDFQIDRYLRGYSTDEYRAFTLDDHDIFWNDETDDFDFPEDYDKFMQRHERNKSGIRDDKFSIIIPHYNTPTELRSLLDNLIAQRNNGYPETEIIVIDDGSTCDISWLRNYPVKQIYQPNRGASAARNVGLMAATGRYIAFVDSDDNVMTHYLHTIYTTMREQRCDYMIFKWVWRNSGEVHNFWDGLLGNYAVWGYAFTWNCIGDERFDENMNVAEDVDWLARVVTQDKTRCELTDVLYDYNWGGNPNSLYKRFERGELPKYKQ